ncbi:uncharacterized protein [Diabrotica undecimpunctata]|uniref:uncharacterized protein n=1 Tax=Diabrotica undecimpunctata TaxID=50387 RepID=UPI003B636F35
MALDGWAGEVIVAGSKTSNLRFADDTTLIAGNQKEMFNLLRRVEYERHKVCLKINKGKTKIMVVDKFHTIQLTNILQEYQLVNSFIYIGSRITNDGNNDPKHFNGVGVIINDELSNAVSNFIPLSDRAMLLQIRSSPFNVNIIQVYAPTADKSDDILEEWYEDLQKLMKLTKKEDINIVLGDFNAKIGRGKFQNIVGEYGLGERNKRGERLLEFCQQHNMIATNTWFKLPQRRLYTWTSPLHTKERIIRNQIDYVLINQRFRNSITSTKTYPSADANSDHNPVVANIRTRIKVIKNAKPKNKPNMELLKDVQIKDKTTVKLNEKLSEIDRTQINIQNINTTWQQIKSILVNSAREEIPNTRLMEIEIHVHENKTGDLFKLRNYAIRDKTAKEITPINLKLDILRCKVDAAIKHLNRNQSSGCDDITAELLHNMDEPALQLMCNHIWRIGKWPSD